MGLTVGITPRSTATFVEKECGLVEIFSVTGDEIESGKSHFCNLMSWHKRQLPRLVADGAAHTVGISDSNVKKVTFARGLIVSHGTIHHVAEIVEFMAEFLNLLPAF